MIDVAIIGGGICGCSLLYSLSKYELNAVLFERENDVGVGTTKANSAIIHAGYDPMPGTLMSKYNVWGNKIIGDLCRELDILYRPTGSLVIGFTEEDRWQIGQLYEKGIKNGVPGLRILEREELHLQEPGLNPEARYALYAPSAGVVNPWELAVAQAEVAVQNGAEVRLSCEVQGISKDGNRFLLQTNGGDIRARTVVNAAGICSDVLTSTLETPKYRTHPNKGQYHLLDTTQGGLVNHVVFQCPTPRGKGVLVAPTVHGNLIVGPDSDPADASDLATTEKGLAYVRERALRSVPGIDFRQSVRNFAGLRARSDKTDFIVRASRENPGYFELGGIKSPGLSSAPAIALDVVRMLGEVGLPLIEKLSYDNRRKIFRFKHLDDAGRAEAIRRNPLYGTIVCRCETVTEGEIVDALRRTPAPSSLDAIKRRCTPGMGRCQGSFCGPRVQAIIARELGIPEAQVPLDRCGMDIILGETKSGHCQKGGV